MEKDVVFVDSCIFIDEKFFLPINRISMLKKLAQEGVISLVSTVITDWEILNHYRFEVTASINNIQKHHQVLNTFDDLQHIYSREYKKKLIEKADVVFEKFHEQCHVLTLGFEYANDVNSVFQKYFNIEKPFGLGDKRKEFPDAFALQILENYCKKNGLKQIIVLSKDGDFTEYESKFLKMVDYKEYLTDKLAKAKILELIRNAIADNKDTICNDIEDQLNIQLQDGWHYHDKFNCEEVSEIEVKSCKVEMKDDFSIVSEEDGHYVIELHLRSYCQVRCTYLNLDYATYDREDDRWYGGEWESSTLEGDSDFEVIAHFDEDKAGELDLFAFEIGDFIPYLS